MSDMSDLELVAQAMAPTETGVPKEAPKSNGEGPRTGGKDANGSKPTSDPPASEADIDFPDLSKIPTLADLDPSLLASLSLEDRQSLLPLLAALQRADAGLEGEGDDEELGDMAEILKQMDQAGEVADELEDKLDRLIAALGQEEEGLKVAVPTATGEAKAGEKVEEKEKL